MTNQTIRAALLLSTVVGLAACGETSPVVSGSSAAPAGLDLSGGVAGVPSKPGAKADGAALAQEQECYTELMARADDSVEGMSAAELDGLAGVLGACQSVATIALERADSMLTPIDAALFQINAANAVIEDMEFYEGYLDNLPTWKQRAFAGSEELTAVPRCGDEQARGACVTSAGTLELEEGADPTPYVVSLEMFEALETIAADEEWQEDITWNMRKQRGAKLAILGLAVVGAAAATVGAVAIAPVTIQLTYGAVYLGEIAAITGYGIGAAGVGGSVASGYGAVRLGATAIGAARAALSGELSVGEYVTCRCVPADAELPNRYHTRRLGWWAGVRDFTDAQLETQCIDDALDSWLFNRDAEGYSRDACEVLFLR